MPSTRRANLGLLGENIMDTGFAFDLEIRMGSGAFVCGEETALMTSIEGNRGEPRPRPPFQPSRPLGQPSVLNNVRTFANVAPIILKGARGSPAPAPRRARAPRSSPSRAIKHSGLVEVPIGVQLGEMIYEIGGGIPGDKPFKPSSSAAPRAAASPSSTSRSSTTRACGAGRHHGLGGASS